MISGMSNPALHSASDVVAFWREAGPKRWFAKSDDFDESFRVRFIATHEAAAAGHLSAWTQAPKSPLRC